jgi:hypothetical protein
MNHRLIRLRPRIATALAAGLLAACGGGGSSGPRLPDNVSTSGEFLLYVQRVIARFTSETAEPLNVESLDTPTSDTDEAREV